MDPKELRANAPLSTSVSDDGTKYVHSSPALPGNKSKSYHEIGSTSMGPVDATAVRPCAIIGPDRVLNQSSSDVYLKKAPIDPWPFTDNTYRPPPDYANKLSEYPPTRNISPRQTFQENMQRIMVPPTYNSIKSSDENSIKNIKLNMPQEAKYSDVPYNMNLVTNELKSVRNPDISMSSVNPAYSRAVPHYGWPAGVNIRPPRPYGTSEIYQYQEYPSCVGPRPVSIPHPHRVHREEAQAYSEHLYQESNIRFKPYPVIKEKHQQTRYDYINNYQNTFHPPVSFPPHKYDLQKSIHPHPFPTYSQVPLKYLDRRVHETFVDGYQRSNQQPNFNPQFHNQIIHPPYGPASGNCIQNKPFANMSAKAMATNKLPYEANNKIYLELDTSRTKGYPMPDNVYYNEINHSQQMRGEILLPNHSTLNMHSIPQHHIYRRENIPLKHYEYNVHHRNLDQSVNLNYSLSRLPLQFSPNTVAISPSDSNTSNDTIHTIGTSPEDCGYVSQSSTNSVRSLDGTNLSKERHRIPRHVLHINGSDKMAKNKINTPTKKNLNVRQFLQMWNEGEDEASEPKNEIVSQQTHQSNFSVPSKSNNNQEQLYVLGLVNVPSEELSKYEHIQKISKLPENIKGYNNIELLNQYEELLESPINNNYKMIPKPHHNLHLHKDHHSVCKRPNDKENVTLPRPVSPLDVEAKISQSVIHKEVGCNFEIKPCSPEMLNVEVATPIQTILGERIIEKVPNPLTNTAKSPRLSTSDDNKIRNTNKIASCDIINKQYTANNYANGIKNINYNVQDFDSNSGICLASLPRLDNDIELNFPEINQQFIKANKIESDGHLFQKDLAQLDIDQVTHERTKTSFQQHSSLPLQFSLGSAPEKEFSKLSKYRKSKKCDVIPKEYVIEKNNVSTVQQRINSVIIKNPDTKLQEDADDCLSPVNNTFNEAIDNSYNTNLNSENLLSSITPVNSENNKMLSFETAIDFSLNKTEETKSYDCHSKCDNEPHYFDNSENMNITSDAVIEKDIISKDKPVELEINQINEIETIENVIINNTPIEYSKIEISDNSTSVTYEMKINESDKENNTAVIKNISSITEIDEYVLQENATCNMIQEENFLHEASPVLNSLDEVKEKNNVLTTIPNVLSNKVESTHTKNIETIKLESTLNTNEKEVVKNDDTVNANADRCDDNSDDKSHTVSESNVKINEAKETLNTSGIFTIIDKNINLITALDNSTVESVSVKKMDGESILYNTISGESDKELELTGVFNEIKEIVNSTEKNYSEEEKFLLPVNLETIEKGSINKELEQYHYAKSYPTTDQFEVNYKTCDDNNVLSNINDSFSTCSQKTNEIETDMIDLSPPVSIESSNNCEKDFSSLNIDLKSSTEELSELNRDKNYNEKELVTCTKNSIEILNNQDITVCRNVENITNVFKLNNTIDKSEIITNREEKYSHIAKELFSPRIQKLLIFNEGICKSVLNNDFETMTEKVVNIDTLNRKSNEDDNKENKIIEIERAVQNDFISYSESCANEDNNNDCDMKAEINNEDNKSISTRVSENSFVDETFLNEENSSKSTNCTSVIRRNLLKRSVSESALEDYKEHENISLFAPTKRKKINHNIINPMISEDLCSLIQTNRRNSISTFYNEDNVYILIDNDLIITEEHGDTEKMYYTEIPEELSSNIERNDSTNDSNTTTTSNTRITAAETSLVHDYSRNLELIEEKTVEDSWVEDVACIETVISDDMSDDIDYEDTSLNTKCLGEETISDDSAIFCESKNIDKIKNIYGANLCSNNTQIQQNLYKTPQMNVNKTLDDTESHSATEYQGDNDILNYSLENNELDNSEEEIYPYNTCEVINEKENIIGNDTIVTKITQNEKNNDFYATGVIEYEGEVEKCLVHSCESNNDFIMSPKHTCSNYSNSSSPEVSSTTSEEKNSSILLKITNHNGSRVSKINEMGTMDRLSYKLTEKKEYQNYNTKFSTSGTLITKAAQKYIPPLKENIRDLKIKLTLPQHRLHTLKQLQISKVEPKIDNIIKYINTNTKHEIQKKKKPKFEDVLKSIDEIQFKKHKDKIKRGKSGIPKVVIKKNGDGAHYASSRNVDNKKIYNPDLTGRKWQPWVFLEKNNFIDKMAIKNKVNAVYCHRKNSYVLAEKFRKYKSIYNANFVISQPSSDSSAKGTLKYTIRLKHK